MMPGIIGTRGGGGKKKDALKRPEGMKEGREGEGTTLVSGRGERERGGGKVFASHERKRTEGGAVSSEALQGKERRGYLCHMSRKKKRGGGEPCFLLSVGTGASGKNCLGKRENIQSHFIVEKGGEEGENLLPLFMRVKEKSWRRLIMNQGKGVLGVGGKVGKSFSFFCGRRGGKKDDFWRCVGDSFFERGGGRGLNCSGGK